MTHLSTLRLHQLRLGELDPAERTAAEAHLDACPTCAARLTHQEQARAAFVVTPVPAAIVALDRPAPRWFERLKSWQIFAFAVPVAAAAFLAVRTPTPEPDTRLKGPGTHQKVRVPILEAWVLTGQSARPLYTGERLGGGARVQLKVDAAGHRFVTLAGRDAEGTVEVYGTVPASDGLAPAPFALTLDDSKGEQRFFAILTDAKPAPDEVVQALVADTFDLDGEVASVTVAKE